MTETNRRDLLKVLGTAAAAAATLPPPGGAEAMPPPSGEDKPRYRESEQVKLFYALLRL